VYNRISRFIEVRRNKFVR